MNIEQLGEIADRYLQGTATAEEKELIGKWLQARPEDHQALDVQQKQTIHPALWQSFTSKTDWAPFAKKTSTRKYYLPWLKYAAAIIILFSCTFWLYTTLLRKHPLTVQTISALPGSHRTATLPDSSVAHLFPGATLTISEDYNTRDRSIALTGKVFFIVKRDPSRPFYVQSGKLRTQVLGTSFEMMVQDSMHASVIVSTGKVDVQYDGRHLADLIPGKRLRYDALQNNFVIDEVNATMMCEWWNHGMVFNQSPLAEVLQTISDWYNVPIEITNTRWQQETVTIRIKGQSFDGAISLLSETLGFQYKKEKGRVIIF